MLLWITKILFKKKVSKKKKIEKKWGKEALPQLYSTEDDSGTCHSLVIVLVFLSVFYNTDLFDLKL